MLDMEKEIKLQMKNDLILRCTYIPGKLQRPLGDISNWITDQVLGTNW
jgi:hypothetical protein